MAMKSGTDFMDYSLITIKFGNQVAKESPAVLEEEEILVGTSYEYNLKSLDATIGIQRYSITRDIQPDPAVDQMLEQYREKIDQIMVKPLFYLGCDVNVKSTCVRTRESGMGEICVLTTNRKFRL